MKVHESVITAIKAGHSNATVQPSEIKYDVYIASGWFNERERKALNMVRAICTAFDMNAYDPERNSPQIGQNPTDEERKANFDANLNAIKHSMFVIASTEGKDMGTIWECGYASANGIPVFGFAPFLPDGAAFNLMLANSMLEVFTDVNDMIKYFEEGVKPKRIQAC